MSWDAIADKYILGRRHNDVVSRWQSSWGDESHSQSLLQEFLEETIRSEDINVSENLLFFSAPGVIQSAISELCRLKAKADSGWISTSYMHSSGRVTWSTIDAHHASLMYARYICGVYGVFFVELHGNWHIVDVFTALVEQNSKAGKYVKVAIKDLEEPLVLLSFPTKSGKGTAKIEQRFYWDVLSRIFRTLKTSGNLEAEIAWLSKFDFKRFHPERNKIFYNGAYWPNRNDLCDGGLEAQSPLIHYIPDGHHAADWTTSDARDHVKLCAVKHIGEKVSPTQIVENALATLLRQ